MSTSLSPEWFTEEEGFKACLLVPTLRVFAAAALEVEERLFRGILVEFVDFDGDFVEEEAV